MTRWSRAVLLLLLSVTLTAAPCAHCTIQPVQAEEMPGHDCCPKQKQEGGEPECTWMPAQYVAPEGATPGVELALTASLPVPEPAAGVLSADQPVWLDESPPRVSPPLYLQQSSLLI